MAGFQYIVTKNFGIYIHFDSDMGTELGYL
jgi:hypothetical protein